MTRPITPHKGGRTRRAPDVRLTPQEREHLDAVLRRSGVKHTDWYVEHVNADYEEITGGNTMRTITVSRVGKTQDEYRAELKAAEREFGDKNRVKVDDGNGGTAWKFFESAEDMRVWKQQK